MVYYVITTAIAAFAIWRWWYWKREAYRTRDAALRGFESIRDVFERRRSG